MSAGNVDQLNDADAMLAVRQILNNPNFNAANPHLDDNELAWLRDDLIWPENTPVFSPYAITHNGYSQSRTLSNAVQ
jgi:hypothetical protein